MRRRAIKLGIFFYSYSAWHCTRHLPSRPVAPPVQGKGKRKGSSGEMTCLEEIDR